MFLEVENVEKMLKARTIDGAFWRYKKLFFLKLKQLRTFWNQRRYMVHSAAIWNDVLEVGTDEKSLKSKKKWCILMLFETTFSKLELLSKIENSQLNGAFWRHLKRCFGSLNCLEDVGSKKAKWRILMLSEDCGGRLLGELLNVEICSSLKFLLIRLYDTM